MTSSEAAAARRFPVGLTAAAVCALAVLVGLGAWQLHRLQWKAALLARIAALQAAPPEPLGPVLRRARDHLDLDFVRVQADCPDIERTPFLKLFSVRDGEAGYRVITACRLQGADFAAILVDRGFVAQEVAGRLTTADAPRLAGPVVGVLRTGDKRNFVTPDNPQGAGVWYWRDVAAMSRALGAGAAPPVFLMLERPAPAGFGPTPAPLPADIPNRHLEYALTWFGLAGAMLAVYAAMLWRRFRT
ncbi:hypothetical protein C5708_12390 [Caulobacter sp. CCUG 60055]|uniref:SURF1 family protein n=1 Tax=Caulobacter sp. CCUG 60055 TaxID=2100090 RepID=UPI001FA7A589|nr:SURF1 family protein [Caulobacter sp. CCUG 60055]MBQ1542362.1 SURF1 family protein [Caulobacteraceae bacterium]MCI3181056.1 hypothetical protein [Caulobacter sp. CCUG 60055]